MEDSWKAKQGEEPSAAQVSEVLVLRGVQIYPQCKGKVTEHRLQAENLVEDRSACKETGWFSGKLGSARGVGGKAAP